MPKVTIYRPNRTFPRRFTITDVARLYCKLVDEGVPKQLIDFAIAEKCGDEDEDTEDLLAALRRHESQYRLYTNEVMVQVERQLTLVHGFLVDELEYLLGGLVVIGTIAALLRPLRAFLRRAPGANVAIAAIEREVIRTEQQIAALQKASANLEDAAVAINRGRSSGARITQDADGQTVVIFTL